MTKPSGTPARITKALHIAQCKPGTKPYKVPVREGLYLLVTPAGGRLWRFKFRFDGKERLLSLGALPEVTLAQALERLADARKQLSQQVDPAQQKKANRQDRIAAKQAEQAKTTNTLEAIAREWFATKTAWKDSHGQRQWRRLELFILPTLGPLQIEDITAPMLLAALRKIEDRGTLETCHRTLQATAQVFRYAKQTGRHHQHPCEDLRGALKTPKTQHLAAATDPAEVGELLRTIHSYRGTLPVEIALKLAPLLFVRPGELRTMKWADVDLDKAEWRYTTAKTGTPHIVPLPTQAIDLLKDLQPLTGTGTFVFPSLRTAARPMSDNAILSAYRRLGIPQDQLTGHGWRATARTLLDEELHYPVAIIELQLAHSVSDPLGKAYNRTTFLPERREMMQAWADYLDTLKNQTASVK